MNFRYEKILEHNIFNKNMNEIINAEKSRKFCCHDIQHLADTARIAYILSLEEGAEIEKDIIYAAALLHDIGRAQEYTNGISHNCAGIEIAEKILKDCEYTDKEIKLICNVIQSHRHKYNSHEKTLENIIYKADKFSRLCFNCSAYDECNWSYEKKNHTLIY